MKKLNTNNEQTFLISFNWDNEKYIFQGADALTEILKNKPEGKGIEYIKRFNPSKAKFENLSKNTIKSLFNYNTEAIELLQKTNFIK